MKRLHPFINTGSTILMPIFIIMTSIRLLISPIFLDIEYHLPGFPSDPYGFTLEERLKWSKIAVEYLVNRSDSTYFDDLYLEGSTPLFNEREISHMVDVKNLVNQMITGWYTILVVLILSGIVAWRYRWASDYWNSISRGGWWTIGLIITILVGVAIGFNAIFTGFHKIFFEGDTWLFSYSDTLIRLFPIRFWRDAFILIGGLSSSIALIFALIGKKLGKADP